MPGGPKQLPKQLNAAPAAGPKAGGASPAPRVGFIHPSRLAAHGGPPQPDRNGPSPQSRGVPSPQSRGVPSSQQSRGGPPQSRGGPPPSANPGIQAARAVAAKLAASLGSNSGPGGFPGQFSSNQNNKRPSSALLPLPNSSRDQNVRPMSGQQPGRFGNQPSMMAGPPMKRQRVPDSPQVLAMRQELGRKISSLADPVELASMTAFGVVGAVRETTRPFPQQFVETTMKDFSSLLDMPQVPKFLERVSGLFQEHVRQFMETTFHTELQQLLEALSMHQAAPQDHILRSKAMKLIQEGDEETLVAMRDLRKKTVTPVAVTSSPAVATPTSNGPREPTQAEKDFCNAALSGNFVTVKNLLAAGTNINCAADSGWTALMNATLQGHEEIVRFLCDNGADLNLQDNGGFTAWMYACSYLRTKILVDLIRRGSDLTLKDKEGRGVTEYASKHPDVKAALDSALQSMGRPPVGSAAAQPQQAQQPQQQQPQQQLQQQPQGGPPQGFQPQMGQMGGFRPQGPGGPSAPFARGPPGFGGPQFGGPMPQHFGGRR